MFVPTYIPSNTVFTIDANSNTDYDVVVDSSSTGAILGVINLNISAAYQGVGPLNADALTVIRCPLTSCTVGGSLLLNVSPAPGAGTFWTASAIGGNIVLTFTATGPDPEAVLLSPTPVDERQSFLEEPDATTAGAEWFFADRAWLGSTRRRDGAEDWPLDSSL